MSRIDPATNKVVATITVGKGPGRIAGDSGVLWVANHGEATVSRIDPATNKVVATIALSGNPTCISAGSGAIWVTVPAADSTKSGTLVKIDPATNSIAGTIAVGVNPAPVLAIGGYVWVGHYADNSLLLIDGTANSVVTRVSVERWGVDLVLDNRTLWELHTMHSTQGDTDLDGQVTRIDF